MTTRELVVQEALTWLGTPYHHQGRIKGAGVDCAMILIEIYHQCGLIPNIDPRPYPPDWHFHRSEERYLGWVNQYAFEVETPKPGDIAVFQFGRCVSHAAVVIDYPTILHSYIGEGCVLGDANKGHMQGRLRGFYSLFKE